MPRTILNTNDTKKDLKIGESTMRARILAMGMGAACLLLGAGGLRADIILQDTATTLLSTEALGGTTDGNHDLLAVGFNTGSSEFLFESLVSFVTNSSETDTYSFTGGIYSDSGGSPGALFASFNAMSLAPNNVKNITFVTTVPTILAANTTYWLLLDGPTAADRYLGWNVTEGGAPQPTLPVSYVGARMSSDSGLTWSDNPTDVNLTVRATTVPEPSAWILVALGGLVLGVVASRRQTFSSR